MAGNLGNHGGVAIILTVPVGSAQPSALAVGSISGDIIAVVQVHRCFLRREGRDRGIIRHCPGDGESQVWVSVSVRPSELYRESDDPWGARQHL